MSSVNSAWLEFVLDESIGFLASEKYTILGFNGALPVPI